MVFTSPLFLFYFFPVFIASYFLIPNRTWKNIILLVFSLLFYAWGEAIYVLVMIASIVVNYVFALWIGENDGRKSRGVALGVGIFANLLVLGYFKYFGFLVSSLVPFVPALDHLNADVHLPLGISFFTFQSMSYLIDVYKSEAKPERSLLFVATYISMFPQLIAGPIVRFASIQEELHTRGATMDKVLLGTRIFIVGLAQKALIANVVALPVDQIFGLPLTEITTQNAWLGAVLYTLQIYFDFSGYSNMAIGLGLMIGFSFPRNFNFPYVSGSITEFWRRWHMSLSSWFRDYLYIGLGGNRSGAFRTYFNLATVFFLCGLWHGASWTFVAWGLYHGFFLVIERAWLKRSVLDAPFALGLRNLYTIIVVIFGWVLFRAESFEQASVFMQAMVGMGSNTTSPLADIRHYLTPTVLAGAAAGIAASLPIVILNQQKVVQLLRRGFPNPDLIHEDPERLPSNRMTAKGFGVDAVLLALFLISLVQVGAGTYNPFIYFRF